MLVKEMFLLFIGIAGGYNIDIDFPFIGHSRNTNNSDYFGYIVHLYYEPSSHTSWYIVGAPKGNYSVPSTNMTEPGVVYRCPIKTGSCQEIKPKIIKNEERHLAQLNLNLFIRKQYGWFGSAISIDEINGILTVCAPRTIVVLLSGINLETMQGMCYSGAVSSNELFIEDKDLQTHDFKRPFWYNPMHGFSVHYPSAKRNEDKKDRKIMKINRIVGEPKHESSGTVDITYANKNVTIEYPSNDDLSQFGYSVESGYFFKSDQLLFASGAPGWRYVGLVGIIDPASTTPIVTTLYGTHIGEFFGASLAVGDLNNDGLDDLLVGAPYWGEDIGRVYAYLGTSKGQFEIAATLQGTVEGGHFGYSITSGDLDADGFDDIIVGTPWEDDGVIYIFNGGPDLKNTNLHVSQRIEVAGISIPQNVSKKIQTFGFSLSKPVDIDQNLYLDIAVGAYKTGHILILRSKPVVKTELFIETIPDTLQRNAQYFLVKICPRYTEYKIQSKKESKITIIVDERYQRTEQTILQLKSNLTSDTCLSTRVNISKDIRDFIEPISIFAKHEFLHNSSRAFCKICAVEKQNSQPQIAQVLLPFNIDCGEDKICNSNISVTAKFHNVRHNDTWVIGSNDISLEINLKNHEEPAYLTMLEFTFPVGVMLRSILTSCQEDASKENLIVICGMGNPIWKEEEKSVKLDLDMKHLINASLYDHKLDFQITIQTRSINRGMKHVVKSLNLVNEVSLSLHGKANEEAYYVSTSNKIIPNITFQHAYQVYKLGASPIEDARLVVKVPLAINDSDTLIHVYKPQVYISGKFLECSSESTLLDTRIDEVQEEPSLDQFYMSMYSNKMRQDNVHAVNKRDLKESAVHSYDGNIKSPETLNSNWTNEIIYMNCSMFNVNCMTIMCDLSLLKSLQDTARIVIKLFLDVDKLKGNFSNNRVVLKFTTEAGTEIIKPAVRLHVNDTRSMVEVVTMFYNIPKMEELQLWIVLVSVLVGLLLLSIFVIILNKLGFFKRKGKQNLMNQESNEVMENGTTITTKSEGT
ncbi:Integrin alpha-4 [Eufriesea mexicana]|uniref:integrin alpha-8-like n=1 Tax=Eufriesea mexicana TaxID=516756 RepID=UPI00083C3D88|nr:PREDICTED: integrin alpha-8-like [Eufriesea mexicana]OAD59083.1 Integrin alpha-4 [Eufriesea mexicana]